MPVVKTKDGKKSTFPFLCEQNKCLGLKTNSKVMVTVSGASATLKPTRFYLNKNDKIFVSGSTDLLVFLSVNCIFCTCVISLLI